MGNDTGNGKVKAPVKSTSIRKYKTGSLPERIRELLNSRMSRKISFVILPVVGILVIAISCYYYFMMKTSTLENYQETKAATEAQVVNLITVIDAGYRMLEVKLEDEMSEALVTFKQAYEATDGNIEALDFQKLKSQYGNAYDFMAIDDETTIRYSTTETALNFNFSDFDKQLGEKINGMRSGSEIWFEQLRTNVTTGKLNKFGYIPTEDHKFLLEIAYSLDGFNYVTAELEPQGIIDELVSISPIIKEVRMFDMYGYQVVDSGENYEPTQESLRLVARAAEEGAYEINLPDHISKRVVLIDLNSKRTHTIADTSRVVEITYDESSVFEAMSELGRSVAVGLVIILIVLTVVIRWISNSLTAQIEKLKDAAVEISQGNYSVDLSISSRDEIGELAKSFDHMIAEIHTSFHKIEAQNEALEDLNYNLERKVVQRTQELEYVSTHDPLTDLYNRNGYVNFLKQFEDEEYQPVGMFVIDVDGLKKINDTLGHEAGDQLLYFASEAIKAALDGDGHVLARIGGDEFVAMVPKCSPEDLEKMRQKLDSEIQRVAKERNLPYLSMSVGMEHCNLSESSLSILFKQADAKMYQNKATRRRDYLNKIVEILGQGE